MKKIVSICCFIVVILNTASSQEWKRQYGFSIGPTSSNYLLDNIKSGVSRSSSRTFNGQLSGWVTLSPSTYFGLETGLSITGLGAILNQSEFGSRDIRQDSYWLQIPVNFVTRLPLADSSNFFLKTGGYIGFGLFGKNYVPSTYTGSTAHDFSFGNKGTQKGMDLGWNIAIGYKMRSGYLINLGYQQGLKDIAPADAAYKQRNHAYTIGLGYEF